MALENHAVDAEDKENISQKAQSGKEIFFSKRKVPFNEGQVTILCARNPSECCVAPNFNFRDAHFVFNDKSYNGETFYIINESDLDTRVEINEDAEIAYSESDKNPEMKGFRDFEPNDLVLVKYAGYVRRAYVLSASPDAYSVFCVDYGTPLNCVPSQIRAGTPFVFGSRFLAVPCSLHGLGHFAPPNVIGYVSDVLSQLDRSSAELKILGRDARWTVRVEINVDSTKMSVAEFLLSRKLIDDLSGTPYLYTYARETLLKLITTATPILIPDSVESIRRPFIKPQDLLAGKILTERHNTA